MLAGEGAAIVQSGGHQELELLNCARFPNYIGSSAFADPDNQFLKPDPLLPRWNEILKLSLNPRIQS